MSDYILHSEFMRKNAHNLILQLSSRDYEKGETHHDLDLDWIRGADGDYCRETGYRLAHWATVTLPAGGVETYFSVLSSKVRRVAIDVAPGSVKEAVAALHNECARALNDLEKAQEELRHAEHRAKSAEGRLQDEGAA